MTIKWQAKIFGTIVVLCLAGSVARSDPLECRNGSLIKGKFIGGAFPRRTLAHNPLF